MSIFIFSAFIFWFNQAKRANKLNGHNPSLLCLPKWVLLLKHNMQNKEIISLLLLLSVLCLFVQERNNFDHNNLGLIDRISGRITIGLGLNYVGWTRLSYFRFQFKIWVQFVVKVMLGDDHSGWVRWSGPEIDINIL